jgi:hypothetical protein
VRNHDGATMAPILLEILPLSQHLHALVDEGRFVIERWQVKRLSRSSAIESTLEIVYALRLVMFMRVHSCR